MKRVSVIVPIYNAGHYLEACINSISGNTYQNLQIILVNDGSTDQSGEICDKFAENDRRIVVIHQPNAGIVAARNAGLCIASGDYISFVDADDQIAPGFYAKMVAAIENENADIAACEYRHKEVDLLKDSNITPPCSKTVFTTYEDQLSVLTCAPSIRNVTWTGCFVWNKLYRTDRITEPFKKECLMGEDLRFNYEYIKISNKMVVLAEGLYFYRIHEESITGVYQKKKESPAKGVANANLWAYIAENTEYTSVTLQNYLKARAAYMTHGALWRVYLSKEERAYCAFAKKARGIIREGCSLLCRDKETYGIHVRCAVWSCAHAFYVWRVVVRCNGVLDRWIENVK